MHLVEALMRLRTNSYIRQCRVHRGVFVDYGLPLRLMDFDWSKTSGIHD